MKSKKQHKVTALLLAGVMMLSAPAVYAEEMATPETATPETAAVYDLPETAAVYSQPEAALFAAAPVVQDAAPDYTKGDTSCEIQEGTFTKSDKKYYGSATFYDYYGDNERTGQRISSLQTKEDVLGDRDQWNDQNAFQWNYAIDAYFQKMEIDPLYFGGARFFNGPAWREKQNLQRWTEYRTFGNGYVNNKDTTGSGAYFPNQGIAAKELGGNDQLQLNTENGVVDAPYFSKTFVRNVRNDGEKNPNGYVYENVSFPFTWDDTTQTWLFDSTKDGAQLKEDKAKNLYFIDDGKDANGNRDDSKGPVQYQVANNKSFYPYFFPFNKAGSKVGWNEAYKLDYMFGMRLELPFNLSYDRKTVDDKDTVFRFAGDDDIWVYIDGKLVLDMGGSHGTVAGAIDFTTGQYMVSGKWGGNSNEKAYAMSNTDFWEKTAEGFDFDKENDPMAQYKTYCTTGYLNKIFDGDLTTGVRHTIQIFYMERGWDQSNLKMSFNFSQKSRVEVTKTTDVSGMNAELFGEDVTNEVQQELLNQSFDFTVKNQVTFDEGNASTVNAPLAPAKEKEYLLNGESYTLGEKGILQLKNGDKAVFTDQFAYDSYLQVSERLQDDRFTPVWSLTENDYLDIQHTITRQQAEISDETIPDKLEDVPGIVPYDERVYTTNDKETVPRNQDPDDPDNPAGEKSLLLRPYSDSGEKVNLQIDFTNVLNVGTLTLQKKFADGQSPEGSFKLLVLFSNIAGTHIDKTKAVPVELNAGNNYTETLKGIPYGTEYTVYEVSQDGWTLESTTPQAQLTETDKIEDQPVYTKYVAGTVNSRQAAATVVFTNRKENPPTENPPTENPPTENPPTETPPTETPATETPSPATPQPTTPPAAPSQTVPQPTTTPAVTAVQATAAPQPTPAAVQAAIPQTGDTLPVAPLMLLAGVSLAGMALCVLRRRKQK